MSGKPYWAPRAWIDGRWADAVLLRAGDDGLRHRYAKRTDKALE